MLLREYRARPEGLADLLNWAALVDDGVILNKDGSLMGAWSYRGPDLDSATDEQVAQLQRHLNQALLPLGSDWMLSVDAVRSLAAPYPAAGDAFPDPVTALIDDERRQSYGRGHHNFETHFVLALTHMPPAEIQARAAGWLVVGRGPRPMDWFQQLSSFRHALDELEDLFGAHLNLQRLDSADLLQHLHRCLTGLDHPVAGPKPPVYLDAVLASDDFRAGFEPRIGPRRINPISITGLPTESEPAHLDFLSHLPICFRWSSRWLPLDAHVADRHLLSYRMKWFQKRRRLTDTLRQLQTRSASEAPAQRGFANRDAADMAEDADEAVSEASGGTVRYGYYTPTVILIDEDEARLKRDTRLVLKELRHRGFPARLETVNAVEAFLGSLPGHGWPNVRRPMIHTRNLADLLPVTAMWPGREHCPSPMFPEGSPALLCAATGSTPFHFNLHASDVGHTLVIGPTGSGKSTLLGLLMAQFFRYPLAQVFAFDKGYSAMPLVAAAGGELYDIAAPESDRSDFFPLARVHLEAERAWAGEWLETLLALQGLEVGPALRTEIHRALELLAVGQHRTLTNFCIQVQSREVREALRPYTLGGPFGSLLDADHDALTTSRFQVFEVAHLMELGEKVVVPVLLYLFHRIEARLDGRPTLLVLDEAWTFLLHSLFAERIRLWLKELRKKNAAVVFATQSLADIRQSDQRHLILESCPTRLLLPNAEARGAHVAPLYAEIGLNPRELEIVAGATPKRDYYFVSPEGRRLIDLDLGPFALSFIGAGDKESLAAICALRAAHGAAWPAAWLRRHGLDAWADRFHPQAVNPHSEEASA